MRPLRLPGAVRRFLVARRWVRALAGDPMQVWIAEPVVRREVNRRVTGCPDTWPLEWLAREVVAEPLQRAVSLGCGEGSLERDLRRKGLCRRVLGLDLAESLLELARRRAAAEGLGGITYQRADLDRLVLPRQVFQGAFAHHALHHVERLEHCLDQVAAALVPGGILYLDEYVGPSRGDWRRASLADAQGVYDRLPPALRRRRRLPLPVDRRDPSEAVRSADILPLVRRRFTIRQLRPYGGILLSVIYPHLQLESQAEEERTALLLHLLAEEERLLATGSPSHCAVLVATPR